MKPGAIPLKDMVTNKQRNIVMSNEAFAYKSRAKGKKMKMVVADKK